jgi:hypothetical protein
VLIVGLTIVQINTAFIENVSKQFSKGMPRALGLDYKGNGQSFTDLAKESTGLAVDLTDRIRLIDA